MSLGLCGLLLASLLGTAGAQDLPGEIRGYKVHTAKVRVQNRDSVAAEPNPKDADVITRLDDPVAADFSLTGGIRFEISGELQTLQQSGLVDFLMFRDFRVNGLEVEVEEYRHPFEFKKNRLVKLPAPIRVSLGFTGAFRGALQQMRDSPDTWRVTGRVLVFGRFKKFGLHFKRVVPVDVDLQIRNPFKAGNS